MQDLDDEVTWLKNTRRYWRRATAVDHLRWEIAERRARSHPAALAPAVLENAVKHGALRGAKAPSGSTGDARAGATGRLTASSRQRPGPAHARHGRARVASSW